MDEKNNPPLRRMEIELPEDIFTWLEAKAFLDGRSVKQMAALLICNAQKSEEEEVHNSIVNLMQKAFLSEG